ncbi:4'-phosphopantetheinyl transferase superfamily protein [Ramlibacter sp. G-1-2-2]|uniref:Enterobactin synthase component D n=1 Tax=Ramlibacter agri TaxID=2728837 RepID=A0A848H109_9BURK|nr:4'-phosphopantetheinyl transferase superfamily protein [Ramlibacter agri]NML44485.1 4'-phosphopantetheinyl transferase superfamily protein [Ramlibacter agri]
MESHYGSFLQLLPVSTAVLEDSIAKLGETVAGAEAALVLRATEKRRREFAAGRLLAHRALAALDPGHGSIGADGDGVPAWPPATTGCITHGAGRVAVAVASRGDVRGIGIDMEAVGRFHRGLEPLVLSGRERGQVEAVSHDARQARAAVLFCAKEAWFKCQFPLLRRRLGFADADVAVNWESGRFVIRPPGAVDSRGEVAGCSSVHEGIARAAIVLATGPATEALLQAWRLPGAA